MKKIPTLFVREYKDHNVVACLDRVTPGLEWVLEGKGVPTVKYDGSCCAVIDNKFYKRFDAKKGRNIPEGAIPCCDPDEVTGHWPHWVECKFDNPADKWFIEAFIRTGEGVYTENRTYEAIGPHFQGNPYKLDFDILIPHGVDVINSLWDRSYEGIKEWFRTHWCEGIVFWKDGEPACKIKRTDFGMKWPDKED